MLVTTDKFSSLNRRIIWDHNIDNYSSITLDKALGLFQLGWLLMDLDTSLKGVEEDRKSKEEHDKYVKGRISNVKKLSLEFHPDAKVANTSNAQQVINKLKDVLSKVHGYVMKERHPNQKYGFIYRLFGEQEVDLIYSSENLSEVMNVTVCNKLYNLAYLEGEELIKARNNCLKKVESYLESINKMYDNRREVRNCVDSVKEEFEQYKVSYQKVLVENLKLLSNECRNSQELKTIKTEVDKLLEESKEQYKILKDCRIDKVKPDEVFVQPFLEYFTLMNMYRKFIIGDDDMRYRTLWPYSRVFETISDTQKKFTLEKNETSFTKLSKEYIKTLSYRKLSEFSSLMVSCYNEKSTEELKGEIDKYYSGNIPAEEEIKNVLFCALNQLTKLLKEKFKPKETFLEREKRINAEAEEEIKWADQRIKQEVERVEQIGRVNIAFTRKIFDLNKKLISKELRDIVIESQGEIVEATVQYIMKYNSTPEQVLNAIMEEIVSNKDQVIKDKEKYKGKVSSEIIEQGIKSLLSQDALIELSSRKSADKLSCSTTSLHVTTQKGNLEAAKKDIVKHLNRFSNVYIVRGKDRGASCWHCVLIDKDKKDRFLEKSGGPMDVKDYGSILYSGWGQDPPQSITDKTNKFLNRISNDLFLVRKEKGAYHYVLVDKDKREMFLEKSRTGSIKDIESYGRVLYFGWGQDPPESISHKIASAYLCVLDYTSLVYSPPTFVLSSIAAKLPSLFFTKKINEDLHDASRNGELGTVRYFIRKGVDVNGADKNGWTSLHHAAYCGKLEVVELLVDNRADIHAKDVICGRKPVHIAAREGHENIVEFFLSSGIGVDDADENNWMPLHYAAWNGHFRVAKLLISKGADIHTKDITYGKKPIHIAAGKGHTNVVELFLSGGIGIDDTDKEGRTALYYAAWNGHLEVMKFLMGKKANIHAENTYGTKPIHVAAMEGHQKVIEFLLSNGVSINDRTKNGCTPLYCATSAGQLEVVEFLIQKGADINTEDNDGKTPLDLARKGGHTEIVNMLDGTEKKNQLLETNSEADGSPESCLSGVTISNQSIKTRSVNL